MTEPIPRSASSRGRRRKGHIKETEEQKQIRLEIKLLRQEEAKKKRFEQLKAALESKIQEESRLSKLNFLKIQEHWRIILRLAKTGIESFLCLHTHQLYLYRHGCCVCVLRVRRGVRDQRS